MTMRLKFDFIKKIIVKIKGERQFFENNKKLLPPVLNFAKNGPIDVE
jgi:hypothetical protein